MTVERRISICPSDVKAIVFECIVCNARVSIAPEKFSFIPENCPYGHTWQGNIGANYGGSASRILAESLKALRNPIYEKTGFKVFLEVDEPQR